jgi:hypothetical protein
VLLSVTILVTAKLKPSFNEQEFPLGYKFAHDLRPAAPGNAADPERVGLFLPVPVLYVSFTAREKFATGMPPGVNFISLSAPAYPISMTLFSI